MTWLKDGLSGVPSTCHVGQGFFTWRREVILLPWQLRVPRARVARHSKWKLPGLRNQHRDSPTVPYWSSSHRAHPGSSREDVEPQFSVEDGSKHGAPPLICYSSLSEILSSLRGKSMDENDAEKMINIDKIYFFLSQEMPRTLTKIDSWQMRPRSSPDLSEPLDSLWFKLTLELFLENLIVKLFF